jgi:hypothetical protein
VGIKADVPADMATPRSKLIGTMIDSEMFGISDIHQTIIAMPAAIVKSHLRSHTTSDYQG